MLDSRYHKTSSGSDAGGYWLARHLGVQIAQRAREDYEVPVVFLTAFSDPETIRRARESDPYGFIVKPFVEEELYATVEIALRQHAERKRMEEETLATIDVLSSTKEELRAVTARVFRIQEEERAQIAIGSAVSGLFKESKSTNS